ncbi:hypothetical protein C8R45DRAFT_1040670 [Mycena sanguinolenta]|nr:hypothetical protein C8R45DRAFT_1040670 [Mycena sanguinolenta]
MMESSIAIRFPTPESAPTARLHEPLLEPPARLDKPLVIPRVLERPRRIHLFGGALGWGKPFVRAYSPALEAYGISRDEFLGFIDELNIARRGNLNWQEMITVGASIKVNATTAVARTTLNIIDKALGALGAGLHAVGKLGTWNSACGPWATKVAYLRKANEELFGPRGLWVRELSAKELRAHLGMEPDVDLALPLEHDWMHGVPSQKELFAGKRATIRTPHRQIFALQGRVAETDLASEAAVACRSENDSGRRWAAKGIRDGLIFGEIGMEVQRGTAITLRDRALGQRTKAKREKGLKVAHKADFELRMANRNRWLVIEEVAGATTVLV